MDRQQHRLDQLHIEALAGYCANAARRGERAGLVYCHELFRRSFDERDDAAWAAVAKQYHGLVCSWLIKAGAGRFDEKEVGDVANDVLAKFWRTLLTKVPIGDYFKDTPQLLAYLNRCAVSTLHDLGRRQQAQQRVATLVSQQQLITQQSGIEAELVDEDESADAIAVVRRWVGQHVTDELEILLLKLLFEQGLKPRQVVASHPEQFPDIRTVRRTRERILKRARRSPLFQATNL